MRAVRGLGSFCSRFVHAWPPPSGYVLREPGTTLCGEKGVRMHGGNYLWHTILYVNLCLCGHCQPVFSAHYHLYASFCAAIYTSWSFQIKRCTHQRVGRLFQVGMMPARLWCTYIVSCHNHGCEHACANFILQKRKTKKQIKNSKGCGDSSAKKQRN